MKKKRVAVFAIPIFIVAVVFAQKNDPAKIDEWSSRLIAEQVEWAEVAKGYGAEKRSYEIPTDEYSKLVSLLETIIEDTSSRKRPEGAFENDYFLAFRYDQKLWLFQCLDNGSISLTFEDDTTAAYYGCENSLLYIDCPELWEYIINTVDSKTTMSF